MSQEVHPFIRHLQSLQQQDRGAMATLRHSLAFEPGHYPKAYPYVERFVSSDWPIHDARRGARYAVAALFAMHPERHERSLAQAMGELLARKQKAQPNQPRHSLEMRFVALLEADAEGVMNHLRQAVSLLAAEGLGFDHAALLSDLAVALDDRADPGRRDRLKRQWARDFYRALQPGAADSEAGAVDAAAVPTPVTTSISAAPNQ